eukprot:10624376-Alexandrium_andersonii.AAC.1
MSASLVGSEMCIRDSDPQGPRAIPGRHRGLRLRGPRRPCLVAGQAALRPRLSTTAAARLHSA